ncbi:MAG: BPSS1780 family membrane protein [Casimicrobiaceae bacterium]
MSGPIEPRVVEAGRGATWWNEAWQIYKSNFWTWIAIMVVYIIVVVLIIAVPIVGLLGHSLLTPVFMGGLMLGCQAIERDAPLKVAHLFEGFQGVHFVPLLIIGAVNVVLTLVVSALSGGGILGGMSMSAMMHGGAAYNSMTSMTGLLGLLSTLVVAAIGAMLNWFAPALVALRGTPAIEAMRASFASCLRNWVPFLVYSAIGLGVAVGVGIIVTVVLAIFGAAAFMSGGGSGGGIMEFIGLVLLFVAMIAVLGVLIGPIVFASQYSGYKDTLAEADALANPAYN